MAVVAMDLGGTKLASAIFSNDGDALFRQVVQLGGRQGDQVGDLIIQQLEMHLAESQSRKIPIDAVGVSVPGIYHQESGRVWAPNIAGWDDYPLYAQLAAVARHTVIEIDSDRACYILGELWQGAAQGCRNATFLAVGTGIGAGILVDGLVLRGHRDIAGAIGWLALDRPYLPQYEQCGCFEHHASGAGIAKMARALLEQQDRYTGILRRDDALQISAEQVFAAQATGDALANEVVENCIAFWAMAVANLVSLFNPEKIIFGGGVFGPACRFLDRIEREAAKWAQPISMRQVSLEASLLGGDAGLIGAGRLALNAIERSH